MTPRAGGAAGARAVSGLVGKAAQRVMPKIAAKATRAGARQAARTGTRQGARTGARTGGRGGGRQGGRQTAETGNTTRPLEGRTTTRDPVDVATGEVVLHQVDVELPGVLPLVLDRTHVSSFRAGRWFGPGWSSTLDQRLEIDGVGACLVTTEGRVLTYPIALYGEPVTPLRGERWPLTIDAGEYTVTQGRQGTALHFAALPNAAIPGQQTLVLPLKAITDRNGNRIDLDYDGAGTLVRIRHSGGYVIDVDTDDGLITALRVGDTVLRRFGYDDDDNLVEVAGSSGVPTRFDYDAAGRLARWTDTNGHWYAYAYDEHGRAIRGTGSHGYLNAALTYYDDRTVLADALGRTTTYHLDEHRRVVAETDPLGGTVLLQWDPDDRLTARTDPLGRTVRYTYDEFGNLTSVTGPDGARITATYDHLHHPTRVTKPDGSAWRYDYDERGNLVAETDPSGATTRFTYDDHGALAAVTNPLGETARADAGPAGLPAVVTDPRGATTRYRYDELGRVAELTDPLQGTYRFRWTAEGRLAARTFPDGATEHWTYDHEGNVVQYVDPEGQVTHWTIGPFDQPTSRTAADGTRLEFGYDAELRLVSVTTAHGLVWRYAYDAVGNLTAETDFNGRTLRYAYDAAGQLVARTNGAGQVIAFTRDLQGNVVRKQAGDAVTTFTYDRAGRLTRAVGAGADLRLERDALGRITTEICNGRALTRAYDVVGNRTHRRTPSGAESSWSYDAGGLPVGLRTADQTIAFEHDLAGREVRRRFGAGTILDQRWDAAHRLTSQALWHAPAGVDPRLLQHRAYTYRPDGHLTAVNDRLAGEQRFDLDRLGRVTAVHARGWSEGYAYDALGNISRAVWPSGANAAPEAAGDRAYTGTLIRRAGRIRYEHDAQGRVVLRQQARLSSKPLTWRYHWDAEDRLTAVQTPDGHWWRYVYDPLGRRIAKQHFGPDRQRIVEQTDFTWDGLAVAEQEHHAWPAAHQTPVTRITTWEYEPGTFRPVAQAEHTAPRDAPQQWIDRQFHAIVTDLVGTPAELVRPDGEVARSLSATLWGVPRTAAPGRPDCPLRFPGQYADSETGLHYAFHRYYDPETGGFQSPDPLGLTPQPNPHAYVTNPKHWADFLGLSPYEAQKDLASLRRSLGLRSPQAEDALERQLRSTNPKAQVKKHTLGRLDYGGTSYYGMNGRTPPRAVDYPGAGNGIARKSFEDDAEGDVFAQAMASQRTGGNAVLHTDRPPCPWCARSMAGYARALDLDSLLVYDQAGLVGVFSRQADRFLLLRKL